jgi:hypothetical protein
MQTNDNTLNAIYQQKGDQMGKRFYAQDAATFLDVPETTLRFWRSHGTGPTFLKIGKRISYLESDLLEFIESRRMKQSTRKTV